MKCPTCADAEDNKCCSCGKRIWKKNQVLENHPYFHEMTGSTDKHLMCNNCKRESAADI